MNSSRPTFEYLLQFFEDYERESEMKYVETDDGMINNKNNVNKKKHTKKSHMNAK